MDHRLEAMYGNRRTRTNLGVIAYKDTFGYRLAREAVITCCKQNLW